MKKKTITSKNPKRIWRANSPSGQTWRDTDSCQSRARDRSGDEGRHLCPKASWVTSRSWLIYYTRVTRHWYDLYVATDLSQTYCILSRWQSMDNAQSRHEFLIIYAHCDFVAIIICSYLHDFRWIVSWRHLSTRRAIAKIKQPMQKPIIGCMSPALPCYERHVKPVVPAVSTHQSALSSCGGLWPVPLVTIHKNTLCPSIQDTVISTYQPALGPRDGLWPVFFMCYYLV
jgi:hypothetical protein